MTRTRRAVVLSLTPVFAAGWLLTAALTNELLGATATMAGLIAGGAL